MGVLFSGSLALYSLGMFNLNQTQQVIGWPLFMTAIILTTQFWGYWYQEFSGFAFKRKLFLCLSILALIIAIILLAVVSSNF